MSFFWHASREQNYRTRCEGELAFEILGIPTNTTTPIKPYDAAEAQQRLEQLLHKHGTASYRELVQKVADLRLERAKKKLGGQI
jgi:hypothetical protein